MDKREHKGKKNENRDFHECNHKDKLLQKWKARLGLSDWDITVQFRDAQDMDGMTGSAIVRASLQNADIRLMNENDRQKSNTTTGDIELDLVHELVHVRLWAIDPAEAEGVLHTCREQAVEWIAKALIETDRQNQ